MSPADVQLKRSSQMKLILNKSPRSMSLVELSPNEAF
jgi:hypothetical protein